MSHYDIVYKQAYDWYREGHDLFRLIMIGYPSLVVLDQHWQQL